MLGVDAPWAGRGSIFCCISTKLSVHTSVPRASTSSERIVIYLLATTIEL